MMEQNINTNQENKEPSNGELEKKVQNFYEEFDVELDANGDFVATKRK